MAFWAAVGLNLPQKKIQFLCLFLLSERVSGLPPPLPWPCVTLPLLFLSGEGWAWVRPIGGTQGILKWAGEKIYKEKMKLITFQMPQEKKIQFWVSRVFSHLLFLYFPSAFEITNRSGYPNESFTACPKVIVILLYRYLQDTGSALISSVFCTVLTFPPNTKILPH